MRGVPRAWTTWHKVLFTYCFLFGKAFPPRCYDGFMLSVSWPSQAKRPRGALCTRGNASMRMVWYIVWNGCTSFWSRYLALTLT